MEMNKKYKIIINTLIFMSFIVLINHLINMDLQKVEIFQTD